MIGMAKEVAIIVLTGWFLIGVVLTASADAQPLAKFISETEVKEKIELWQRAKEAYFSILYGRQIGIRIENEASDFVARGYIDRKLPEEALSLQGPVVRAVIQTDLEVLLDRAFLEAARRTYGAIAKFFAGDAREVRIRVEDVENALKAEDCNIIPCNPKDCDPDTCTKKSFQRFAQ
jgi:hypothetical protein